MRQEPGVVRVDLFGSLREEPLKQLELELKQVGEASPGRTHAVVFTTAAMMDADERSRQVLVRVQRNVSQWARRSVWVDGRAAYRGMALWVMHLADDQNCKAVANEVAANVWLNGSEPREELASRRAVEGGR